MRPAGTQCHRCECGPAICKQDDEIQIGRRTRELTRRWQDNPGPCPCPSTVIPEAGLIVNFLRIDAI